MRVDLFDFHLPAKQIAQTPAEPRDSARLLHVGETNHDLRIKNLPDILEPGDVLVVNNTKVLPCRLFGQRYITSDSDQSSTPARVEVTLHKQVHENTWHAFARPARKLRPGNIINFAPDFQAIVAEKLLSGEVILQFDYAEKDILKGLEKYGIMPLPPYIKRNSENRITDRTSYQTLFASKPGAAAAPTAGLHFTPTLIKNLLKNGVEIVQVTLHVGAGTFVPIKVEDTRDHLMYTEWADLSQSASDAVNRAHSMGKRVIAVGSTSLRLLESASGKDGKVEPFCGDTNLFIFPGYQFKVVDLLLTNFHLPRSTLFMLVSAFAGLERMHAAYAHAIKTGYRFFSYGDACLLEPNHEMWGV